MQAHMLVLGAAMETAMTFPTAAVGAIAVGFVAAVILGSIAWYNSKRPAGWEDKERPDIVPEIDQ
ncbi:MAG: hypothetical protein VKJ09_08735 [Leptolyngbya sp.]|nr:hypothetical protein [Leptolyngbya sp.]